jgi:hypothetical protein
MKNKVVLHAMLTLAGVALAVIGAVVFPGEEVKAISGVLIGGGAGLFGMSVANLVNAWMEATNPQYRRKLQIENGDERNQIINNAARSRAYQAFTPIFGILMLVYVLLDVDLLPILLLVAAYLVVNTIYIVNLSRLNKEM